MHEEKKKDAQTDRSQVRLNGLKRRVMQDKRLRVKNVWPPVYPVRSEQMLRH